VLGGVDPPAVPNTPPGETCGAPGLDGIGAGACAGIGSVGCFGIGAGCATAQLLPRNNVTRQVQKFRFILPILCQGF
jgi:hypothetical protein